MRNELKPCPFCKQDAAAIDEGDDGYMQIICPCTAFGPLRASEAEAIAAWNAAYDTDDRIKELREALTKCRDTFRDYERQHQAKAQKIFNDGKTQGLLNAERMSMNARLTKAKANADMADMCDAALKGDA